MSVYKARHFAGCTCWPKRERAAYGRPAAVRIEDYRETLRGQRVLHLVGKGNKPAAMPLTVPVLRVLEACRAQRTDGPLVLRPVSGKPIDRRDWYRMVVRIAKAATVVGTTIVVVGIDIAEDGEELTARCRRGQVISGALDARRADLALNDLSAMPLKRAPHLPLLRRCWELRDNLTTHDAPYVALAEALDVLLLTGDRRVARASVPRCPIELLRPTR